jgi:membrane-associated phospholipid phosphatase
MTSLSTSIAARRTQSIDDSRGPRLWQLPSRQAAGTYLTHAAIIGVLFVIGYGGANWLAGQRDSPARVYWDGELEIPFIPQMIWVYLSINLLFLLPVFCLRTAELHLLGRRMIAATLIAVAVFVAMPTALGFARPGQPGDASIALELLYALDQPFNCMPSLHVAYSTLIILAVGRGNRPGLKLLFGGWLALITASTLLIHQHHLIDIAAAHLMIGVIHFVSRKTARPIATTEILS